MALGLMHTATKERDDERMLELTENLYLQTEREREREKEREREVTESIIMFTISSLAMYLLSY